MQRLLHLARVMIYQYFPMVPVVLKPRVRFRYLAWKSGELTSLFLMTKVSGTRITFKMASIKIERTELRALIFDSLLIYS